MFFVKNNIFLSLKQIFKNSLKRSKTIFKNRRKHRKYKI